MNSDFGEVAISLYLNESKTAVESHNDPTLTSGAPEPGQSDAFVGVFREKGFVRL